MRLTTPRTKTAEWCFTTMPRSATRSEKICFLCGFESACRSLAVWHEGEQFVGVLNTPLKDVLADIKDEINQLNFSLNLPK